MQYVKPTPITLKNHPSFSEKWVSDRIAEDPSLLGLGDLEVKDVERMLPKAGRLDLLLSDPETGRRYEVELMLGTVDESHIIRTLEYWDIERKRLPQYDHCAVLVAETITARFLNVIGLFNGVIPLIAIQMNAFQMDDKIMLTFTRVLDEVVLATEEEDSGGEQTNRGYWEGRASKDTMALLDECFSILRGIARSVEPKYNKHYVGIAQNGSPNNFAIFMAKRHFLRVSARVSDIQAWTAKLEDVGFSVFQAGARSGRVPINVYPGDLEKHRELLTELFTTAYEEQQS